MLLVLLFGIALLGLVVIADLEGVLFRQAHAGGERLGDVAHQFGDAFVVVDRLTFVQLRQVLLGQVEQGGEHHGRRGGSGVEIPVFDGGVDAGIGFLLSSMFRFGNF